MPEEAQAVTVRHGADAEPISKEACCTVCRLRDETGGDMVTASYTVFPGMELAYHNVHLRKCCVGRAAHGRLVRIDHCREGRMEVEALGQPVSLAAGDLSVCCRQAGVCHTWFPLHHYQGISIEIDLEQAPPCLSCFLDGVNVSPQALADRLCPGNSCFVARSDERIGHIFSGLYSVPDSIKMGYFRVKILELMLFFVGIDIGENRHAGHGVTRAHADLAEHVQRYLTEHMDRRLTLEQLSRTFHISGTQIKQAIRAVYGVPLYSFIRTQKMESAARLLRTTDKSVLEIAGLYGYDNGSKFASAFRNVMGMAPNAYRNCADRNSRMCD